MKTRTKGTRTASPACALGGCFSADRLSRTFLFAKSFVLPVAVCLFVSAIGRAAEPGPGGPPFIESIFPRGGAQGSELEVKISGRALGAVTEVRVSGEGVAPSIMASSESTIDMKISVAPDAPVGRRDLRVSTPQGSFVQIFEVGSLPERTEAEPNDDWREAPPIEFPIVINGQVPSEDYDHFRIEAQAGQVVTFDLRSSRVGTLFDAVRSLMDSQGNEVGHQDDDYFDKDPRLVHRFDAVGKLGIDYRKMYESGIGRPVRIVDEPFEPVPELIV